MGVQWGAWCGKMETMNAKTESAVVDNGYPEGLKWGWAVACALGALAGALYWATSSWTGQPGMPAAELAGAMGWGFEANPLNPLWAALARWGGGAAGWTTGVSAISGALAVGLLSFLTMRVRHSVHDRHDEAEGRREHAARYAGGITAGLFLAGSVPFWVASTRTVPESFHLALLLLAGLVFSEYQRAGKAWRLALLGAVYGVGLAEFPTFWLLLPLAGILVVRALLQRAEFRWGLVGVAAGWGLAGALAGFGFGIWAAGRFDAAVLAALDAEGWWGAARWFAKSQAQWLSVAVRTTGWLLVTGMTVLPWCILFLMRGKKPAWRYGYWQTLLRLAVLGAGAAVMFGAPITPWHFFGMGYLMVTPVAILAACTGYAAGEFWVMGQTREHRNAGIGHWPRKAAGLLGLAAPVAAAAALAMNGPAADAGKGESVRAEARRLAEGLEAGEAALTDGVLDALLECELREAQKDGVVVVSLPRTGMEAYRKWLGATRFGDARSRSLLELGVGPFLQDWLGGEGGKQTVAVGVGDQLGMFGETRPEGLATRLGSGESAEEEAEREKGFRERMEAVAAEGCAKENPAWAFREWMLRVASKQVNNTAFRLLEKGNEDGAREVLESARRIYPGNLSALLNLLGLAARKGDGSEAAYRAEWEAVAGTAGGKGALWRLGAEYGYVFNTGLLVQQGMMWAVSGKPKQAEAVLRKTQGAKGGEIDVDLKSFLGQLYLLSGDQEKGAEYYGEVLREKPDDVGALLAMARLAIQQGRLEDARDGFARLRELGADPNAFRFEELLMTAAEGRYGEAVRGLSELTESGAGGPAAWGALAVLAARAGDEAAGNKAVEHLRKQKNKSMTTRLLLAHLLSTRQDWAGARAELEQMTRMNPGHARAWEMLLRVDYAEHKRAQAEDHVRMLLTLEPGNSFGNLLLASFQRERGQMALAESSYRAALATERTPPALNDLADLLMRREDGRAEARTLLDEALSMAPGDATAHMTRAELNLLDGRLEESGKDLQAVLTAYPGHPDAVFLAARLYAASGKKDAARELANGLEKRRNALSPENQAALRDFLAGLREEEEER